MFLYNLQQNAMWVGEVQKVFNSIAIDISTDSF